MTEEEAKTKACCGPMSQHYFAQLANPKLTRRDPTEAKFYSCIGSRCMAWRWLPKATGYCGLAGAPDWDESEAELPQ